MRLISIVHQKSFRNSRRRRIVNSSLYEINLYRSSKIFQKFKASENKIAEQHDLVTSLREELDKSKQALYEEKDVHRKLQTEIDVAKSQFLDMQRTERVVRVDMEQASKRVIFHFTNHQSTKEGRKCFI